MNAINYDKIKYHIVYGKVKNLYIHIKNGEVIVKAPRFITKKYIDKIVEQKRNWILKKLEETGRIQDVSEAFKEFPAENEWHKGKIESFLEEEKEVYDQYNVGDIVFVKEYLYKNGKKGTNHLFVIIEKDNYAVPIEYFTMLISSHLDKLKFSTNKLLLKDELNKLKRDSIVKTDVIYKVKNEDIEFKIGEVTEETVLEYKKNLEKLF